MALVTVVVPVRERVAELQRALASVHDQSLQDFECIVVDDGSESDIAAVVAGVGDPRFRVIRRDVNGGPTAARRTGWEAAQGEFLIAFDSDWELYPWALEQGVNHLRATPAADIVTGLHVRDEDSRLFVRVRGGARLITPEDFRRREPLPDRIALVRRNVVERWLAIPGEYWAMGPGVWITAELHHSLLAVDEPWVRYHTDAEERITTHRKSASGRERTSNDFLTFLRDRPDLIDCGPCISVDRLLESGYFVLVRSRAGGSKLAAASLRHRGISPAGALAREVRRRLRRRLHLEPSVAWV